MSDVIHSHFNIVCSNSSPSAFVHLFSHSVREAFNNLVDRFLAVPVHLRRLIFEFGD